MPPVQTGPTPTLANGNGGYQVGVGPLEPILGATNIANYGAYTGAATITVTELLSGLLSYTGAGHTLTLPTAALIDAALPNAGVGNTFEFGVNATTGAATLAGGAGITTNAAGVGSLVVAAAASARFRLVKTAAAAWNLYRVA